jgi:hypothetical protein
MDHDATVIVENIKGGMPGKPKRDDPPIDGHDGKVLTAGKYWPDGIQLPGQQSLQNHMLIGFPNLITETLHFRRGGNIQFYNFGLSLLERTHHGPENRLVIPILRAYPQTFVETDARQHANNVPFAINVSQAITRQAKGGTGRGTPSGC